MERIEIRRKDDWVSIHDFLISKGYEDPKAVWTALQLLNADLKEWAKNQSFKAPGSHGRQVPIQVTCIEEKHLPFLSLAASVLKPIILIKKEEEPAPPVAKFVQAPLKTSSNTEREHEETFPEEFKIGRSRVKSPKHLRKILDAIMLGTPVGTEVNEYNLEFMTDLLSRHRYAQRQLENGILGIRVDQPPGEYRHFTLLLPHKEQKISILNYLNPAPEPFFELRVLQRAA